MPGIHVFVSAAPFLKTWVPGTSPGTGVPFWLQEYGLQFYLAGLPELQHEILELGGVVRKADAEVIGEIGGDRLARGRRRRECHQPGRGVDRVAGGGLQEPVEIDGRDRSW